MFQQFLYTSEGKTVTTYLNLIDATIKPVALYVCESWGYFQDQNDLGKLEKFHISLCNQMLRVQNNTGNLNVLLELDRYPFKINIETLR